MSVRSFLGTLNVRHQATPADELHAARVRAARAHAHWTELDGSDLVARGFKGRLRVSAETDRVYTPVQGTVFAPGSSSIVALLAPLHYVVTDSGVDFYEQLPETWSEIVARRTRPRRATKANKRTKAAKR